MLCLVILPVHLKGQPSSKYFRSLQLITLIACIFQVTKTFHFFKNDIGFINKLLNFDDLSVIDLIVGAKVIRFVGQAAQV